MLVGWEFVDFSSSGCDETPGEDYSYYDDVVILLPPF